MDAMPYRRSAPKHPAPPPRDPYLRAWGRLRLWRALFALGIVLWLGVVLIGERVPHQLCVPFVVAGAFLIGISMGALSLFACPKCGETFGARHPFCTRCLHCGLPIGTPKNTAAPR